ncbi:ATP-binding protein, partial [Candidatus Pelagibacter sp.]|nr:ATP-binding protein [Candidatus Pelagibacter sp.]
MLTELGLKNFKVFQEEQKLKLGKKFTLIYGSNSSGKSSLFQAIQIIKETLNTPDSGFKYLGIQGEMNDFINKNNKSKEKTMSIAFEAESGITSRVRSFGVGLGLTGISRMLDAYKGVLYPIKFRINIKIKLDKDEAKLEKITYKLKFKHDENSKENFYDGGAQSAKTRLNIKKLKEKEILILELEAQDKIKKANIKKYFPNYRGKYDKSFNDLTVFKLNDITNEDKIWKVWWQVRNKYLKGYEREKENLFRDVEDDKNKIKKLEQKIKNINKSIDFSNKKTLPDISIADAEKLIKDKSQEVKNIQQQIKYLQRRQPRVGFRGREFQRTYPNSIIEELTKCKTYNKFKSIMINDLKKNLKFTSLYLDFSKNMSKFTDLSYGYRTLNPIGDSILERFANALQFGRLYYRDRMYLPFVNITRFPEAILSNLNKSVFNNIFTVHSTESEFSDSYRMRQDNYDSVGRDGKNTPYILIKNKKTLSSINKTLKEVMNIELSLSKGKLQGENHFIFKAKDTLSGKVADTVKMKLAGKGFNSIIPYLTEIMMHEKSMILLEEIENSLHPKIIS